MDPVKCFICTNLIEGSNPCLDDEPGKLENKYKSKTCRLFATLACRYLGISSNNFTPEKSIKINNVDSEFEGGTFENESNKISACNDCLPILKQFCDMYYRWNCIGLQLREITKTILRKLSAIKRSKNSLSRNTNDDKFENGMQDFRTKLIGKVGSPDNGCWPRVRIEKLPERKQTLPVITARKRDKEGRKIVPCRFCGKEFTQSGNRKRHERAVHTKIQRFKCKFCGQKFGEKVKCCQHERLHTGEKPFKCKICGFAFTVRQNLVTHIRTHTGEKKHQCKFCHQKFTRLNTKNNHERMQHVKKDLPFKCAVCGELFAKKLTCIRHQQSVHKMEKSQVITLATPVKARKRKVTESENSESSDDAHGYSDTDSSTSEDLFIPCKNSGKAKAAIKKRKTPPLKMEQLESDQLDLELKHDLPVDPISLKIKNETGLATIKSDFEAGEVFVAKYEDKRGSIVNDDEEDGDDGNKNCFPLGNPNGLFILPDD